LAFWIGTEVKRAVQRLFVEAADEIITHVIKNPHEGCPDTKMNIDIFRGQPIIMIQDSKHGLKTFRNNLFSGARLLTLGSFIAIYRHIEELAFEAGTPLYHRDVHKLDRQDDNAAVRLFSAAVIEFLAKQHPDYLGEIIYLFVFGELIDAYQNRAMRRSGSNLCYALVTSWTTGEHTWRVLATQRSSTFCLGRQQTLRSTL